MSEDVEYHASAYAGSITIGVKGNLRILPQVSSDQKTVFGAAVPGHHLEQGDDFVVFEIHNGGTEKANQIAPRRRSKRGKPLLVRAEEGVGSTTRKRGGTPRPGGPKDPNI